MDAHQISNDRLNFGDRSPESTAGEASTIFGSEDLFIAVMGITGAGKSTFISRCCPMTVPVGHGLQSHTSEIQMYQMKFYDKTIHLIDTPGFDDTYRPDVDVLKDLSYWLNKSYQRRIRLTGIIYLHRIIDPRLGGAARKNLEMFKKLCGEDTFGAVVLATTMWERVVADDGNRREQELRSADEFYKSMLDNGANLMRHMDNRDSAMAILSHLVNRGRTIVLKMQHEMSEQGLDLQQTAAGQELNSEILRQTEIFNKRLKETEARMQQAIEEKDNQLARELAAQQDELNQRILRAQKGREELQITIEKLFEEKEKQFTHMKQQYEEERRNRDKDLKQKEEQLEEFKSAIRRAEELAATKARQYDADIEFRKKQMEEAQGATMNLYKHSMESMMAQKQQYERAIQQQLARYQEEQTRQRNDRIRLEWETAVLLARQRQVLIQQPAFYQGGPPSNMTNSIEALGNVLNAGATIAPIALGVATTLCNIM